MDSNSVTTNFSRWNVGLEWSTMDTKSKCANLSTASAIFSTYTIFSDSTILSASNNSSANQKGQVQAQV